jgi:hypothetical protein
MIVIAPSEYRFLTVTEPILMGSNKTACFGFNIVEHPLLIGNRFWAWRAFGDDGRHVEDAGADTGIDAVNLGMGVGARGSGGHLSHADALGSGQSATSSIFLRARRAAFARRASFR